LSPRRLLFSFFWGQIDSQCIYHLAKEAGVKFDAHYNLTTVDPPELMYFIRENYPDVIIDKPIKTMWQLIVENGGPPTQIMRFCCRELKERGGEGRICVTGVRWAESTRRKNNRNVFEIVTGTKKNKIIFNDNGEGRKLFENCMQKGKRVVNPIVDWDDINVWDYLNSQSIPHCSLYDEGFNRLGCIGCPMATTNRREREFERWPKYKANYIRAFERMLEHRRERGKEEIWASAEAAMHWWIYGSDKDHAQIEGQMEIDELEGVR